MPVVKVIEPTRNLHTHKLSIERTKRRVAAYARVSTDSDDQENSFDAQKNFYERYIKENPLWEFVGIYADEGISGTSTKGRKEFQRMIEDARAGKIDLIVAKSMSRFARNTLDTLLYIRELKEKGVECYFQKENIYTFDSKGELLITIMSSLAQEESRSISENVKWGIRKSFADGKVYIPHKNFLGYKYDENKNIVIDKETEWIVRLIYKKFLEGKTFRQICNLLMEKGIKSPTGKDRWRDTTVRGILKNEKYYGSAILQKTFIEDFLTHKSKTNNGEVTKYYVKDSHPGIIPKEEWDLVQLELERRHKLRYSFSSKKCFSSKLICVDCGHLYGSKVWHSTDKYKKTIWQCNYKFDKNNKHKCLTPTLNEEEIKRMFIRAYNTMLSSKEEVIANLEEALKIVSDVKPIIEEIKTTNEEIDKVVKETEDFIYSSLDKETDRKKELELQVKYDDLVKKLKDLEHQKEEKLAKESMINAFIATIKDKKEIVTEFNEELFNVMIEKAIVNRDKSIEFIFNSGYKVKVEARN